MGRWRPPGQGPPGGTAQGQAALARYEDDDWQKHPGVLWQATARSLALRHVQGLAPVTGDLIGAGGPEVGLAVRELKAPLRTARGRGTGAGAGLDPASWTMGKTLTAPS